MTRHQREQKERDLQLIRNVMRDQSIMMHRHTGLSLKLCAEMVAHQMANKVAAGRA